MIATDLRTLYIRPTSSLPKLTTSDSSELRRSLEEGPDSARLSALKSLIVAAVNGERELVEGLLMTLIRFVLPLKDKTIKKLLLLLFENMNKTDSEGNLKQEFILVWYL
jgi:coatomer subunit beta